MYVFTPPLDLPLLMTTVLCFEYNTSTQLQFATPCDRADTRRIKFVTASMPSAPPVLSPPVIPDPWSLPGLSRI